MHLNCLNYFFLFFKANNLIGQYVQLSLCLGFVSTIVYSFISIRDIKIVFKTVTVSTKKLAVLVLCLDQDRWLSIVFALIFVALQISLW